MVAEISKPILLLLNSTEPFTADKRCRMPHKPHSVFIPFFTPLTIISDDESVTFRFLPEKNKDIVRLAMAESIGQSLLDHSVNNPVRLLPESLGEVAIFNLDGNLGSFFEGSGPYHEDG